MENKKHKNKRTTYTHISVDEAKHPPQHNRRNSKDQQPRGVGGGRVGRATLNGGGLKKADDRRPHRAFLKVQLLRDVFLLYPVCVNSKTRYILRSIHTVYRYNYFSIPCKPDGFISLFPSRLLVLSLPCVRAAGQQKDQHASERRVGGKGRGRGRNKNTQKQSTNIPVMLCIAAFPPTPNPGPYPCVFHFFFCSPRS